MDQKLVLLDRKEIAQKTMEFYFAKPEGFEFKAGQNVTLKLPELLFEDKRGPIRVFTIVSAPHEEQVVIATRMSGSGFKETLKSMLLGSEIDFSGPRGKFYLQDSPPKAVFIAGGIGITPFKCMLLDATWNNTKQDITLLYSNRSLEATSYHKLFSDLSDNEKLTYVPTITKETEKIWQGEQRSINFEFITDYVSDIENSAFYLCGPPAMVEGITTLLKSNMIDEKHLFSESFWGY